MGDDRSPNKTRDETDGDRKRLDELDTRLRAAHESHAPPPQPSGRREMGFAYRVMVEMIAGLGFGGVVGWGLDSWLGTTPILLVVMVLLGFAAGVMNAFRASKAYTAGLTDKTKD